MMMMMMISLKLSKNIWVTVGGSTGPGPDHGHGTLQSIIALVRSWNMFWSGLVACVAIALLFWFISHKPHFTSATKKESN